MAGNSGKRDAEVDGSRDVPSEEPRTDSSPVLDDVSDAELDAIVGKLRTDKSRTMAPATQARSRWEQMSERLHRGRPLVSVAQPPPRQVPGPVWYVALGAQASGPHDVAALKAFWDRGELAPDSLCWREGFSAWLPLSQVPELAGVLMPAQGAAGSGVDAAGERPPATVAHEAPLGGTAAAHEPALGGGAKPMSSGAPQPVATHAAARGGRPVGGGIFERTAAGYDSPESVDSSTLVTEKVAVGDASPTPGSSAPSASAAVVGNASPATGSSADSAPVGPFATPAPGSGAAPITVGASEPGGAAAQASDAAPPHADVGTTSSDPAGTHAVLAAESRTGGKRSRWRGAVWLTAAGGVVGVVTVAVAMGLLGFDGRALLSRLGLREDAPSAPPAPATAAVTPSAEPVNAGGATAPSTASTGTADVASSPPAPAGAGVAATAAASTPTPASSSSAATSSLGAVGIDRGGSLPALSASRGGASSGTDRASAWPPDSELDTDSAPSPMPASRSTVAAAALERRPDATPVDKATQPSTPPVPASTAPKSDVGPDEDYEKELLEPPPGLGGPPERTVYVPPDPSKPREILPQSDIFEVVAANKDDITACAAEEHPSRVGTGGRVVVRWTILPSGLVQDVVTETPSLRGTPLAHCIESKVRRWTFPRHQEQSGPVRFPFVF